MGAIMKRVKLSVVVPFYNEEKNIGLLHAAIEDVLKTLKLSTEIIFVDDGSTDNTAKEISRLAQKNRHLRPIFLRRNFGQTAALQAGFDHAAGEIIITLDGDLQNDPKDIPRLLAKINEGFDVVSGWRQKRKDIFLTRRLPSILANSLISKIGRVKLHDYGCTLKAYKKAVVKDINLYGEMHRFIPVYAAWQGAKVTEIPVRHHPRKFGKSKYGLVRIFKVVLDLIVVKFLGGYSQKPIYLFGGFGFLSFLLAFLAAILAIYYKYWGHKSFIETPLPVVFMMLILIGFISILMGLLAEINIRTYFESQRKKTYLVKK